MASASKHVPTERASGADGVLPTDDAIRGRSTPALASPPRHTAPGLPDHLVQFYATDDFLVEQVSGFLGSGLRGGDACVVIATALHRERLEQRLADEGLDLCSAQRQGTYFAYDAAETLALFMGNGSPDPERFRHVVGSSIARAAHGKGQRRAHARHVRAFGEMVALLWAEGNPAAAIRLEELWNELGAGDRYPPFSLFCAYPMGGFAGTAHAEAFRAICERHTHISPDERYTTLAEPDERLRAITMLQQQASSLVAETAQRQQAEARLRVSENLYRHLFEASTDGILMVDADTHAIVEANPAVTDVLGRSREDLLGQDLWLAGVFPDPDAAREVWRALEEQRVVRLDTLPLRTVAGGQLHYVEFVGNRFQANGHDVVQCHLRDVTERTQAAEAQRELEARKDAFISMASHELRTPITTLKAFTQILQRRERRAQRPQPEGDPHVQQVLGRMDAQLDRMTHLIADLLDLSKMQVGKLAFHDTTFDLDALVHDTVDTLQAVITTHQLRVEGATRAQISGDWDRLGQVLINLLTNATKYSPGADHVLIRLRGDHEWVEMAVQDFGIGIAPEHQERVFERFYQADDPHGGTTYPGLGIGLYIARTIVERHGGRMRLESRLGSGSTFSVRLPLRCDGIPGAGDTTRVGRRLPGDGEP